MKPHLWFVRTVSRLVPSRFRSDWQQEWEAELYHRKSLGRSDVLRNSLGSFWDALAMQPRRLEDEMFQDLHYGIRMLIKHKALTVVAVLSLAIGIGANTAVFSVANTVLMKKLPVRNPDELVVLEWFSAGRPMVASNIGGYEDSTGRTINMSFAERTFEAFRSHTQALSGVAAYQSIGTMNIVADGNAEIASGELVSGSYYRTLGVQTVLGRAITDEDDRGDATPVAVLNHRYWQRRFGLDPNVLGKTVTINTVPFTIIGVTPPEFSGTEVFDSPDIFMPIATRRQIRGEAYPEWQWWLRLMGRLKPGATPEQVHAELGAVFRETAQQSWDARPPRPPGAPPPSTPFAMPDFQVMNGSRGDRDNPAAPKIFSVMLAIVGLVLLIVCANVANLLIARGASRQNEIAIRGALGASRTRVLRQLLVESVLLASCGGTGGVLLAYWGKSFMSWLPGSEASALRPELDMRVLAFTVAMTLFTGILFGLAPGLHTTRVDACVTMKNTSRTGARSRSFLTRSMLVVQLSVSLVLLVGAGLLTRNLNNLQTTNVGFDTANLLAFRVDPVPNKYSTARIIDLYDRLIDRIAAIPGIQAVTSSENPLLSGSTTSVRLLLPGQQVLDTSERSIVHLQPIRSNFFETIGMTITRGRSLSDGDQQNTARVAVINQTLARRFFGNDDPIGKSFNLFALGNRPIEVVGVVRDAKYHDIRRETPPIVFVPYLQTTIGSMAFEARAAGNPDHMIPLIRAAVREVDPNLPIIDIKTQAEQINERLYGERLFASFSAAFGGIALLLACMGMYGLMSYNVTRRTNEIGIRMALGAYRSNVLGLVMRETLMLVLTGMIFGIVGAIGVTRVLSTWLFGLAPNDMVTIVIAAVSLTAFAVVAGYLPARKASRLDPLAALRYE